MYDIVVIHGLFQQMKEEVRDIVYDIVVMQELSQQLKEAIGYIIIYYV